MKHTHTKRGFTFVETLVAITILVIGITAPLTIIVRSIRASETAQDRVFAYYLAQEAIEYIRYSRDTNILNGLDWLAGMDNCSVNLANAPCEINNPRLSILGGGPPRFFTCPANCTIVHNDGQGVYGRSGGAATKIDREIYIDEIVDGIEAEIRVVTTWTYEGVPHTFELREEIFNWSAG